MTAPASLHVKPTRDGHIRGDQGALVSLWSRVGTSFKPDSGSLGSFQLQEGAGGWVEPGSLRVGSGRDTAKAKAGCQLVP